MSVLGLALGTMGTWGQGGCSSSSSGPPALDQVASAVADSYCSALRSCCERAGYAYDNGSCKVQLQFVFQRLADSVKRGKVFYDPNAVAACQAAYAERVNRCSVDGGPPGDAGFVDAIADACSKVFRGTVKPGEECTESAQCATASAKENGSCRTDSRPEATSKTKKVCFKSVGYLLSGQPCRASPQKGQFETRSCDPRAGYCEQTQPPNPDDPGVGTCKAYAKIGEDCVITGGTGTTTFVQCDPKVSQCDVAGASATRKCVALPTLPGAGSACTTGGQCADGHYCNYGTPPNPPGTCALKKAIGETCNQSQECSSSFCDTTGGVLDGGPRGVCVGSSSDSARAYEVTPRSCGFGPSGTGPEEAGIQPPATSPLTTQDLSRWYDL